MWEWLSGAANSGMSFLGSDAGKNAVGALGSGLSAYGTYAGAQNQKKQFNAMFDLEKSQLARDNKKEDDRQKIIDDVYSMKLA